MKIGIMGGTFNPIHQGHVLLAECAMKQYSFDEIWFMPSGQPAHKSTSALANASHRIAMIQLALEGRKNFILSTIETERAGNTYTADTLLALTKQFPAHKFYFLIGGDSLMNFDKWSRPEVISSCATLVAAGRDGYTAEQLHAKAIALKEEYQTNVLFLDMPPLPISSREIRQYFFEGKPELARPYLDDSVWQYLCKNPLYQ